MTQKLRIALAQLNLLVGDIEGNADKIISVATEAHDQHQADLIVYPELALTGYPPEDLLLRPALYLRVEKAIDKIKHAAKDIDLVLGYPEQTVDGSYNKSALFRNGQLISGYYKQHLPNYSVFDEMRYFKPGSTPCVVDVKGVPIAITICEDLCYSEPISQAASAGAKLTLSLNASPFDAGKDEVRKKITAERAIEGNMPIAYVNCVGGQDELVFDGGSMVIDAKGKLCAHAEFFKEELLIVDFEIDEQASVISQKLPPSLSEEERVYKAITLGIRDYIEKNNFKKAIIGLSGGIDSALTLAIAVDAIGKDRVEAVMMPSRYTQEISITDAKEQADLLGIEYHTISIEPIFQAFLDSLADEFAGLKADTTEENLQARCRGTLLMAISNKKGAIVLATGNKSEMSVGYSTLYGDMVGGFCVLKDIPKTLVYRLANYRNSIAPTIPQRVIDRPPSAELAEGQKDEDFLPPYSILDEILERYIEKDQSVKMIIEAGFEEKTVKQIAKLVDRNEYKRRQAAPGVRISQRAFGRDRRYPITSGYGRHY